MSETDSIYEMVENYRVIARALRQATAPTWLELELSMAQLKALFVVARAPGAPVGTVAELLNVGLPTASHLIDRLVQAGLVERRGDPSDRRRTLADLTSDGQELVSQLHQGSMNQLHAWMEQMDEADFQALQRGFRALAEVIRRDVEEPSYAGTEPEAVEVSR